MLPSEGRSLHIPSYTYARLLFGFGSSCVCYHTQQHKGVFFLSKALWGHTGPHTAGVRPISRLSDSLQQVLLQPPLGSLLFDLFLDPIAHQAPVHDSSQEYWSGCHCLLQRIFRLRDQIRLLLGRWILYNRATWEVVQQVHGCSNACLLSCNENKTKQSSFSALCKDCKHFSLLDHSSSAQSSSALGTLLLPSRSLPTSLASSPPPAPTPLTTALDVPPTLPAHQAQGLCPTPPHPTPTHGHLVCVFFVQASCLHLCRLRGGPFSSSTCI